MTINPTNYVVTKVRHTKREDNQDFPVEAFAYVPDAQKPSTWKLRIWDSVQEKETKKQIGMALAALGPGFRGNRVEIPIKDIMGAKEKVLTAWKKVHDKGEPIPTVLKMIAHAVTKAEGCPIATGDVSVNLKNRQKAIRVAKYGPLNPDEPNEEFWSQKASTWSITIDEAKKSRCGNCSAFIKTRKMKQCIANGLEGENEWDVVNAGELGYCEMFDFKCASSRTCGAWITGGPVE